MPRGLNSTLKTELAKDGFRLCNLIYIDVGSGIRLTDYAHDITYSSNTYSVSDHVLNVGEPKESRELRVNTMSLSLSGVEQTYISLFLSSDYVNRQILVQKAAIAADGSIVGAPFIAFDGRLTRFEVTERKTSSEVIVEAASHWADFDKKSGRLTNNNSQQQYFPGDVGFEYAANTIRDLKWGRK
jgi:hypothetical protein